MIAIPYESLSVSSKPITFYNPSLESRTLLAFNYASDYGDNSNFLSFTGDIFPPLSSFYINEFGNLIRSIYPTSDVYFENLSYSES